MLDDKYYLISKVMQTSVERFPPFLKTALKEWTVAVQALVDGDTILLLRKGGIREEGGQFRVRSNHILLYPTVEHQKPHLLKTHYAEDVQVAKAGWHPDRIELSAWATIDTILPVRNQASLDRVLPFHVWNQRFVSERMNWKPHQPLYLLLLRTYRLPSSVSIPYLSAYGGCRSWIALEKDINLDGSHPVLSDSAYEDIAATIRNAVGSCHNTA
ncbi:MAG: DUF1802 family protein [Synechococcus sp.]